MIGQPGRLTGWLTDELCICARSLGYFRPLAFGTNLLAKVGRTNERMCRVLCNAFRQLRSDRNRIELVATSRVQQWW